MDITVVDALFGGGIATILITLVLTSMSIASFGIIIAEGLSLRRDLQGIAHLYAKSAELPYLTERLEGSVWEEIEGEISALPAEVPAMRQLRLEEITSRQSTRTWGRLSFLASIGANAPFVGLFGTVVGVMGALTEIGKGAVISATDVGPPVGEALVMTAFGLLVAVPAVFGYNMLITAYRRRNQHIEVLVRRLAQPKEERVDLDTAGAIMASRAKADVERSVKDVRSDPHGDLAPPAR